MNHLERFITEAFGPTYPEATVILIDALRDYIRMDNDAEADAQIEGWTCTAEERRKWAMHMQLIRLLLKELEEREVDPWLNGTIEYKP
jgi:hypothetical protein